MNNVKKVVRWFEDNHMKINPDQFQYVVFGAGEQVDIVVIDNCRIHPQKS